MKDHNRNNVLIPIGYNNNKTVILYDVIEFNCNKLLIKQ